MKRKESMEDKAPQLRDHQSSYGSFHAVLSNGDDVDSESVPLSSNGKHSNASNGRRENEEEDSWATTKELSIFLLMTGATVSFAVLSTIPFILICKFVLFDMLTGRWYTCLPLVLFRCIVGAATYGMLLRTAHSAVRLRPLGSCFVRRQKRVKDCRPTGHILFALFVFMASAWFHGFAIPAIDAAYEKRPLFREPDGTFSVDWAGMHRILFAISTLSSLTFLVDVLVVLACCVILAICTFRHEEEEAHGPTSLQATKLHHKFPVNLCHGRKWWNGIRTNEKLTFRILQLCRLVVLLSLLGTTVFGIVCFNSAYTFFGESSSISRTTGEGCDPLDATECLFPFPSNFYTVPDKNTVSGLRVSITTAALQTMYKGKVSSLSFLEDLDGFSTAAPILFYLQGLKEGHEQFAQESSNPLLVGPQDDFSKSVTRESITLLVDTSRNVLVHHYAEIDYLDAARPCVILQPTQPLRHNTTYAVVVAGAVGADGRELFPTYGMQVLMQATNNPGLISDDGMKQRALHFQSVILPAVRKAAPWLRPKDVSRNKERTRIIQLLFDFHTASAESQLGMSRRVRNAMMRHLHSSPPPKVRVIKTQNRDGYCPEEYNTQTTTSNSVETIARTIHAEIDVAWFMQPWDRHAALHGRAHVFNPNALNNSSKVVTRPVKVLIMVPCSLARTNPSSERRLNAVVDYGHSFLYSRKELTQTHYLQRMANENGWLLMASDWRGMSVQDSPLLFRMCMSEPDLVRALRDSLLQGYAERAALQHFARHGLLEMDFLQFQGQPLQWSSTPRYLFYGYSQGGILGAGYSVLMGPTKLLDGVVLESPGSPLALLMSRSVLFPLYRRLLLTNLRNNRHVRIAISFIQMGLDSIEVAGLLAPPLSEPHPPTLIQAGLGDTYVSTIGTAFMSRAFDASLFPHAVRRVVGLSTVGYGHNDNNDEEIMASMVKPLAYSPLGFIHRSRNEQQRPHAILTEVLYRDETESMPTIDVGQKTNYVHYCARQDFVFREQAQCFINDGVIVDSCARDPKHCIRHQAWC